MGSVWTRLEFLAGCQERSLNPVLLARSAFFQLICMQYLNKQLTIS